MSLASTGSLTPSDTRVIGNDGSMIVGANDTLLLEAVSEGNTGEIQVNYDAPSWLVYDWSASGTLDEDPIGIATFGRFRGNDRVIHWREKGIKPVTLRHKKNAVPYDTAFLILIEENCLIFCRLTFRRQARFNKFANILVGGVKIWCAQVHHMA